MACVLHLMSMTRNKTNNQSCSCVHIAVYNVAYLANLSIDAHHITANVINIFNSFLPPFMLYKHTAKKKWFLSTDFNASLPYASHMLRKLILWSFLLVFVLFFLFFNYTPSKENENPSNYFHLSSFSHLYNIPICFIIALHESII